MPIRVTWRIGRSDTWRRPRAEGAIWPRWITLYHTGGRVTGHRTWTSMTCMLADGMFRTIGREGCRMPAPTCAVCEESLTMGKVQCQIWRMCQSARLAPHRHFRSTSATAQSMTCSVRAQEGQVNRAVASFQAAMIASIPTFRRCRRSARDRKGGRKRHLQSTIVGLDSLSGMLWRQRRLHLLPPPLHHRLLQPVLQQLVGRIAAKLRRKSSLGCGHCLSHMYQKNRENNLPHLLRTAA